MTIRQPETLEVKLFGGLGNQLFIWSAANAISATTQTKVQYSCNNLKSPSICDLVKQKHSLTLINQENEFDSIIQRAIQKLARNSRVVNKIFSYWTGRYMLKEVGFDSDFKPNAKIHYLEGYFQSYKYFVDTSFEKLVENLDLTIYTEDGKNAEKFIEENDAICIHIRAGDYLQEANSYFGIMSPDYYLQAINEMRKSSAENIFLLTDDISFVKREFAALLQSSDKFFFGHDFNMGALEEFKIISRSRRIVIGNSTFSWWGAYLAGSNANVVAPSKWFKSKQDPKDLIPPNWKTVQSSWI